MSVNSLLVDVYKRQAQINAFLAALRRDDRVMFVKRYWFAQPLSEIADAFGTTAVSYTQLLVQSLENADALEQGVAGIAGHVCHFIDDHRVDDVGEMCIRDRHDPGQGSSGGVSHAV